MVVLLRVGVVGGGIVGLFTSYYLLKGGADVTIIDTDPVGGRASENNAGFIVSTASKPRISLPLLAGAILGFKTPVRVSATRLVRSAGWFLRALKSYGSGDDVIARMARRSLELYLGFFSSERIDVDLVRGVISAFREWEDVATLAKRVGGRLLGEKDLRDLGYVGLSGGVYIEEELSINPVKLYRGLRRRVEDLGARIVVDEAQGIRAGVERAIVITSGGYTEHDSIVIAAGSMCGRICRSVGYDPMVEPARGIAILHRTGGERIVESPALLEDYGVGVAQHGSETLRVTGFFELVGYDAEVSSELVKWLTGVAGKHIRNYGKAELFSIGIGFRPCSADLLPVIGRVPGTSNIYIATGLCRLGVTMAPIAGKIVSSMVLGESLPIDQEILHTISPTRFGGKGWNQIPQHPRLYM